MLITGHDWLRQLTAAALTAERSLCACAMTAHAPHHSGRGQVEEFFGALAIAHNAGVRVRVRLADLPRSSPACAGNSAAVHWLRSRGIDAATHRGLGILHAKALLIDDRRAFIGSGNFTGASADRNDEVWIETRDAADLNALLAWFNQR